VVKRPVKCPNCGYIFNYSDIQEAGMGYVECPKCYAFVTQKDLISPDVPIPPQYGEVPKDDIDKLIEELLALSKEKANKIISELSNTILLSLYNKLKG
jgi:hypothetical protein